MLVLFEFLLVIFLIIFILLTLRIKIEINKLFFSTDKSNKSKFENEENHKNFNSEYIFKIKIYILELIPIFVLNIDKKKINKFLANEEKRNKYKKKILNKIKNEDKKRKMNNYNIKDEIKIINENLKFKIKNIDLNINLGTTNIIITSYLIFILSFIFSYIIFIKNRYIKIKKYFINPIYEEKNIFNININCIFEIKLIHIIITICIIKKKRRDEENERTSNRKHYDYSYE